MSSHPLVPEEIRKYMQNFQIEKTFNDLVNKVLRERPIDPYAYLSTILAQMSNQPPILQTLVLFESYLNEKTPSLVMKVSADFKGELLEFGPIFAPFSLHPDSVFDQDEGRFSGLGVRDLAERLNGFINESLSQADLSNQKKNDMTIKKLFSLQNSNYVNQLEKQQEGSSKSVGKFQPLGINSMILLSFGIMQACAYYLNVKLYSHIFTLMRGAEKELVKPDLKIMIPVLSGGKQLGTKLKFSKFWVYPLQVLATQELMIEVNKIYENIKKSISGGKQGEAKYYNDGTFICPFEVTNDVLRVLEDVLTNQMTTQWAIGISCDADDWMAEGKYELEGSKNPVDQEQVISMYIKLLQDHQKIKYLQDPMGSQDDWGWKRLLLKLQEIQQDKENPQLQDVIIAGARTFKSDIELIKKVAIEPVKSQDPVQQQSAEEVKESERSQEVTPQDVKRPDSKNAPKKGEEKKQQQQQQQSGRGKGAKGKEEEKAAAQKPGAKGKGTKEDIKNEQLIPEGPHYYKPNGAVFKLYEVGTMTDLMTSVKLLQNKLDIQTILSTTLFDFEGLHVDLAVGMGCQFLQILSPQQQIQVYNRLNFIYREEAWE